MADPTLRSKVEGCLLGGAVGDALGAPYEGLWAETIPVQQVLLADYAEYEGFPSGQYTDDTQLTLVTIESIVEHRDMVFQDIAERIASLWETRSIIAPGGACTDAASRILAGGSWQQSGAAAGQAGNGTAMRTAAAGLYFLHNPDQLPEYIACLSKITHQDPRSVAGGVAIAKAAQLLASQERLVGDPVAFCSELAQVASLYDEGAGLLIDKLPEILLLSESEAVELLAWAGLDVPRFDKPIFTPFVVPTVLASLYCVLRHGGSWSDAVASSIRLGGDVDTLGAIVGALMGVRLGASAIPGHLAEGVVDSLRIKTLAAKYSAVIGIGA